MTATRLRRQNEGFTLVEILVAMTLLFIMVTTFVSLFGTGFRYVFQSGQRNDAFAFASRLMEEVYALGALEGSQLKQEQIEDWLETLPENRPHLFSDGDTYDYTVETVTADVSFYTTIPVTGFRVTITAFYLNETNHVTLASFIRGTHP